MSRWWSCFNDPVLDRLMPAPTARTCRCGRPPSAFSRPGQLAIDRGNLFPQTQQAGGSYERIAQVQALPTTLLPSAFSDVWQSGFTMNWELDIWGRLRRAILSDEATLDASSPTTTTCW